MARADTTRDIGQSGVSMLGIYLNDHLAGATAGTKLAHRMARSHGDGQDGSTLRHLAAEIRRLANVESTESASFSASVTLPSVNAGNELPRRPSPAASCPLARSLTIAMEVSKAACRYAPSSGTGPVQAARGRQEPSTTTQASRRPMSTI